MKNRNLPLLIFCSLLYSLSTFSQASSLAKLLSEVAELSVKKNADELHKIATNGSELKSLKYLNVKQSHYSSDLTDIYPQYGDQMPKDKVNSLLKSRTLKVTSIGSTDPQTELVAPDQRVFTELTYHFLDKNNRELSVGISEEVIPSGLRFLGFMDKVESSKCGQWILRDKVYGWADDIEKFHLGIKNREYKNLVIEVTNKMLKKIPPRVIALRQDKHLLEVKALAICGVSFSVSSKGLKLKVPKRAPEAQQSNTDKALKEDKLYNEIRVAF